MQLITALTAPPSLCRDTDSGRAPIRVGLVQHRWQPDTDALLADLAEGVEMAAGTGAGLVCLPEITLLRYPAFVRGGANPGESAEDLDTGPTFAFASAMAKQHNIFLHASLYEKNSAENGTTYDDGLGFNTAIMVSPTGELVAKTRKIHIPITAGYYEDTYFRAGPAEPDPYPVHSPAGLDATLGMPTCWDEWFPEAARAYSLAGAEIIVYPTAIGSEPDFPDFDTQPLWQQVIVGNGIANGTFMVVPNRTGNEGEITFYGSSFISDPYGRILVQAPRDEPAVLVAEIDLAQRRDWLTLFPFLKTRRPDTYGRLVDPVATHGHFGAGDV